jgi:citrate synthase
MKRGYIESRKEGSAQRIQTRITSELPSSQNPFIPEKVTWGGYDLFELVEKEGYLRVVFLLIKGDLPTAEQSRLLESIFVFFANPGTRHPATRAALTAAVTKTSAQNWLPIGLAVFGGQRGGAGEVEGAMRFIRSKYQNDTGKLAIELVQSRSREASDATRVAPGFGRHFGGIDTFSAAAVKRLEEKHKTKYLAWAGRLGEALEEHGFGILWAGIAAAMFLELGFHPRAGAGLAQMAASAGLLAHALEYSGKTMKDLPMVAEDDYEYVGPESER